MHGRCGGILSSTSMILLYDIFLNKALGENTVNNVNSNNVNLLHVMRCCQVAVLFMCYI